MLLSSLRLGRNTTLKYSAATRSRHKNDPMQSRTQVGTFYILYVQFEQSKYSSHTAICIPSVLQKGMHPTFPNTAKQAVDIIVPNY